MKQKAFDQKFAAGKLAGVSREPPTEEDKIGKAHGETGNRRRFSEEHNWEEGALLYRLLLEQYT